LCKLGATSSVRFFRFSVPPQIHPFDFGEEAVNSGDIIITTCVVTKGDMPIEIHWTLNDKPFNQFDGVAVMNTNKRASQLTIESVQAHHRGEYKCIAKNDAGLAEYSAFLNVNGISHINILIVFLIIFKLLIECCFFAFGSLHPQHIFSVKVDLRWT
jgi:hypothetical protein